MYEILITDDNTSQNNAKNLLLEHIHNSRNYERVNPYVEDICKDINACIERKIELKNKELEQLYKVKAFVKSLCPKDKKDSSQMNMQQWKHEMNNIRNYQKDIHDMIKTLKMKQHQFT